MESVVLAVFYLIMIYLQIYILLQFNESNFFTSMGYLSVIIFTVLLIKM